MADEIDVEKVVDSVIHPLTDAEKDGIKAVIHLQGMMGNLETDETALVIWRSFSPDEQQMTMDAYDLFKDMPVSTEPHE